MHVYKREFSVSEGNEFILPAGEGSTCFEIGFPQEGKITRLIVKQADADASKTDFTVDLLDRQVCDVTGESELSLEAADDMTVDLAKIFPTEAATTAGGAYEYRSAEGMSYRNREGTFTVPVRKVYLQMSVATKTATSRWEVAIACLVGNESN